MIDIDLVTVHHNDTNAAQADALVQQVQAVDPRAGIRHLLVDNRQNNRGFAAGCNLGAFHPKATAPIIGFLNPDVAVRGPFVDTVRSVLDDVTVITGCRFDKPQRELAEWGVNDWVCGAAFFVTRRWFQALKGFDEQFTWSWEETDLIRQTEARGRHVRSVWLPIRHQSPETNSPDDTRYKRYHFARGAQRYVAKWGRA